MGSIDIRCGIAHEDTLPFPYARFRENKLHDLGAWLKREAFLITEHGDELHVREKRVDEFLGACLELVRSDRELYAIRGELLKKLYHTRIRLRVDVNVLDIIGSEVCQHLIYEFWLRKRRKALFQSVFYHLADSVSDHLRIILYGMAFYAIICQCKISGSSQIGYGINQSAV